MNLRLKNDFCYLAGYNSKTIELIKPSTSFTVEGHQFSDLYKKGKWDGKVRLLHQTKNGLRFPTGLYSDVLFTLANSDHEMPKIIDERRDLGQKIDVKWQIEEITARDYQIEAVNKAISNERGILKLPIRSGKTVIAALIINRLKLKTLFVATSQLILTQTKKLFERIFERKIGIIGEGEFEPSDITIATVQSLQKMDKKIKKELDEIDILLVDEVHHMQGDSWRKPILHSDARYRIGLSATVTINRELCERSAIWLKAITGDIVMDLPMKQLVENEYIMSPDIFVINVLNLKQNGSWSRIYKDLVVENESRNRMIVEISEKLSANNHKILIDTGRINHIKNLYGLFTDKTKVRKIYGSVSKKKRAEILRDFVDGDVNILVGTVMGEGVDIPILSTVINAEGGKSDGATIQRMRCLTTHPDKPRAIFIDFMDYGNRYVKSHSRTRLKCYEREPAFNVVGPIDYNKCLSLL
jgi:superfamily II DNA or RNA helicase